LLGNNLFLHHVGTAFFVKLRQQEPKNGVKIPPAISFEKSAQIIFPLLSVLHKLLEKLTKHLERALGGMKRRKGKKKGEKRKTENLFASFISLIGHTNSTYKPLFI
jgi:hypothetical protein